MCLEVVKQLKPNGKTYWAWKVFEIGVNKIVYPPYWSLTRPRGEHRKDSVVHEKWLESKKGPGFHFFFNQSDAERWAELHVGYGNKIIKVKVRGITNVGVETAFAAEMKAGAAQQIYIPKEN